MSLTKTMDGMSYELTGKKKVSNPKAVALKVASEVSTLSLLWLLVKRHKVALLAVGNIVLLLNWTLPQWLEIAKSVL